VARGRKRKFKGSFGEFKSRQKGVPANRNITKSTAGSGYQAGADSITNYSPKDKQTMFDAAGGRDNFIQQAANIEQDYKRSANLQGFLDRARLFNQGIAAGGRNIDGRLQMAGADGIIRDAQGRQILSMQAPSLTAQAPTMSQLFGDMGRGLGSIAGGLGQFIGGGGVTGAILNAIAGAKSAGKKGLDFLSQMFSRPTQDAPMMSYDPGQAIRDQEVLAQIQSGSPTVDAITGETYTDLYGGDRDYSGFLNQVSEDPINIEMSESMPFLFTQPISPSYRVKQAAMDRFSPDYLKMQQDLLDEINANKKINTNL